MFTTNNNKMTTSHSNMNPRSKLFNLVVRQQPCKARLCSFKEKVDRRPIDPPPIIQLTTTAVSTDDEHLQNPYFFLYATLTDASGETDLHFVNGNRTTAGTVVQSLHKLKDVDNTDGGFFIFSDISIRLEGFYRLKFTLYEIEGLCVNRICSSLSDIFQVYSPKSFPGMSESTFLTRSFSDQGVRIRIRKEPRSSSSNNSHSGSKRRRKADDSAEDDDEDNYTETSPMPLQQSTRQIQPSYYSNRSPSPLPETVISNIDSTKFDLLIRPTLPPAKEIFRASPMSMQNILLQQHNTPLLFPSSAAMVSVADRLFTTRKLPLPLPSTATTPQQQQPQPQLTMHHHSLNNSITHHHHHHHHPSTIWSQQHTSRRST